MKKKTVIALLLTVGLAMTACGNGAETNNATVETTETAEETAQETEEDREETDAKNNEESTEESSKETAKEEIEETEAKNKETAKEANEDTSKEVKKETTATLETLEDKKIASDGAEIYKYTYTYPVVSIAGNEEATGKIVADQELKKEKFLEDAAGAMSAAESYYQTVMDSNYEYEFYGPGYDTMEYELKLLKGNLLSFYKRSSSYCIGGAMGNFQIKGTTYDTRTGDILDIDEIFEDGTAASATLKEMILNKAIADGNITRADEMMLEDIAAMVDENNWFFAEDGLHFIANEYVFTGSGEYRELVFSYVELPKMKQDYQIQ